MSSTVDGLIDKVREFPKQSGVYLMKNARGKIIYVGKAKVLRNRVRSYFSGSYDSPKTKLLVKNIVDVDYILTKNEVEAFLLEASLIKKHKPRYNIRLKDDKSYPYIRLSWADQAPRLYLSRRVKKDGSMYFGPYTSGHAVHSTIRFLNKTFKIRDCRDHVYKSRTRPCMTHQIGRCTAPCVGLVTSEEYHKDVEGALMFLKGKSQTLIKDLKKRMFEASDKEQFEVAARIRDSIQAIESIQERQSVIDASTEKDQDALGYYGDERGTLVETIHVRQGRVIGKRSHFLSLIDTSDPEGDQRQWIIDFLNQYYEDNIIPDEVLLPVDLGGDLKKLMQDVLKERAGRSVDVRFASDDKGRELVSIANENAKAHFERHVRSSDERTKGLEEIQSRFGLSQLPRRIECFDVSHFQGTETVASQVVFEDGVPAKEHYRRYRLENILGVNDYASMSEVLKRRLSHDEWEQPQLIVIDGGKGQLNVVLRVLKELGHDDIPVVGLAKARTKGSFISKDVDATEERFFLPGRQNPVIFSPHSEAHHILVGIRDEAHRFAITYHRRLREEGSLSSELDMVVGLGEKRKKSLLRHFDSVDAIRAAEVEAIASIKGFNRVLAERVLLQLNEEESSSSEDASVE